MDEEAAFIAAIQASPNDDAPRLIYADWLDERGDPRGEYVRLQVQLANALDRLQHLEGKFAKDWAEAVEIRRDVVVHAYPHNRRHTVRKLVRWINKLDHQGAQALLAELPATVCSKVSLQQAERIRQDFSEVANVTIAPVSTSIQSKPT